MSTSKHKLIYICGMGHNGSTALDLLLDLSDECVGTSQLNDLLVLYDPCDSQNGRPEFVNSFWQKLVEQLQPEQQKSLAQQNRKVLKERQLINFFLFSASRRKYAAANRPVLMHLFGHFDRHTIVDSSKNISRILGLLESDDSIECYVIHLTRDVRGYVGSHNKRRRETGQRPAYLLPTLIWLAKNVAASLMVKPRASNYLHVRYEDMMLQSEQFLQVMSEFIGHSLQPCEPALKGKQPLRPSRSLGFLGNRLLQNREDVVLDPSRVRSDTLYHSKTYWYLLGWVSMFWGYRFKSPC